MPWRQKREFPVVLIASIVAYAALAAGFLYAKEFSLTSLPAPFGDEPPRITLTWTPAGECDLKTMKAHLHVTDDHGLDFTTYRLTVGELGRSFDLPIKDIIGKEYETDLSFSWLANDPRLAGAGKMTVNISISDDHGHEGAISRVIPLKNWHSNYPDHIKELLSQPGTPVPSTTASAEVQPSYIVLPSTIAPSP